MGNASLTAVKVLMALLVLTLAGVFLGLWTFFAGVLASLIAGVLAFVFGFLGLVAALRGRATNRGKSIGGMAFSLLILLFIIWMFLQMMSGLS